MTTINQHTQFQSHFRLLAPTVKPGDGRFPAIDELTGLVNRRRFGELLADAWTRWRQCGEPLTCLMIDVDGFKAINNRYGYSVGDKVLCAVAGKLESSVREATAVARYGGEEFAVVLPKTDRPKAYLWAEQIRKMISEFRIDVLQNPIHVTISVGVAATRSKLSGPAELVCRADLALQDAKRQGRNRVSFWNMPCVAELIAKAGHGRADPSCPNVGSERSDWLEEVMAARATLVMGRAIAEKDHSTGSHCMWVGWLSAEIGRRLGLTQRRTEQLQVAGILHDLGKIGIPETILLKPGPLSDRERDLVDCHAQIGAELVAYHGANRWVRQAIQYHHDWYDGSRGKSGLSRESLLRDARILAVADSFQSMIEDRPYRRRMTPDEAMAELRRCSGSQFDPAIVAVLAEIMESD